MPERHWRDALHFSDELHDKVLAHMWYNLAGANGLKDGAKSRENIERIMSQAQIEIAERMARSWIAIYK